MKDEGVALLSRSFILPESYPIFFHKMTIVPETLRFSVHISCFRIDKNDLVFLKTTSEDRNISCFFNSELEQFCCCFLETIQ